MDKPVPRRVTIIDVARSGANARHALRTIIRTSIDDPDRWMITWPLNPLCTVAPIG